MDLSFSKIFTKCLEKCFGFGQIIFDIWAFLYNWISIYKVIYNFRILGEITKTIFKRIKCKRIYWICKYILPEFIIWITYSQLATGYTWQLLLDLIYFNQHLQNFVRLRLYLENCFSQNKFTSISFKTEFFEALLLCRSNIL